jgi:ComF family protein
MSVLETVVGWLAPPDCLVCGEEGLALCKQCSTSEILAFGERCWRCNRLSAGGMTCDSCRYAGGPKFVWITTNYEGAAQQLVRKYKFGHLRAAVYPIAGQMAETFNNSNKSPSEYLVVPVPTATSRARERSFGHSELLAKTVAARLRMEYSNALRRLGQTRQLGSKREERLVQLSGSFAAKSSKQLEGRAILLVDDVLTTGGTVIAASKVLKAAGAKRVDALLFAKRL